VGLVKSVAHADLDFLSCNKTFLSDFA